MRKLLISITLILLSAGTASAEYFTVPKKSDQIGYRDLVSSKRCDHRIRYNTPNRDGVLHLNVTNTLARQRGHDFTAPIAKKHIRLLELADITRSGSFDYSKFESATNYRIEFTSRATVSFVNFEADVNFNGNVVSVTRDLDPKYFAVQRDCSRGSRYNRR